MSCTVVSLVPYFIPQEVKPGLNPSHWDMPCKGDLNNPAVLVVNDAQRYIYVDHNRGSIAQIEPAENIARALVYDYAVGQPAQDADAGPGLFYVQGSWTGEEIKMKFSSELNEANEKQTIWWKRLVTLADDLYNRHKQLRLLSDLERTAARQLGLKREWLSDAPDSVSPCPVCTTVISAKAIVCFACHVVIKPEELKKFNFLGGAPAAPVQAVNTSTAKV